MKIWQVLLLAVGTLVFALVVALFNGMPVPSLGGPCLTSDGGGIGCFRAWIEPVAAVFTVIAIIYAALQVFEASRQSDAAVRTSLVVLKADALREEAMIWPVAHMLQALIDPTIELHRAVEDKSEYRYADLEIVASRLNQAMLTVTQESINEFKGAEPTRMNTLRQNAKNEISASLRDALEVQSGLRKIERDFNEEHSIAGYKQALGGLMKLIERFYDSTDGISAYARATVGERLMIIGAISELDRDVLDQARKIHERNVGALRRIKLAEKKAAGDL